MRRTVYAVFAVLTVVSAALPLRAEEARQASGKFSGKNWEFEASGAYAYPGEVGFDDEPGIVVSVSNAVFNAEAIDRFWNREQVIDKRFKDDETLVVNFQFGKDGSYKGMTYYFGSGDGCGFCYDGKTVSTVKVAGGRLKGKLTLAPQPDETSWDLELDVPVAPSDYGTPLPAGGGEVGAVYAAYHEALGAADGDALAKVYPQELAAKLPQDKDQIVAAYREDHPDKSYKILKGFQKGDRALLLIEGETSYFKVAVEAHFLKENGAWKLDDELAQVKLE